MAASLSKDTNKRVIESVTSLYSGNQVLGSLGQLGGFQLGSGAAIAVNSGDIMAIPDPGGAPGTYRALFPNVNKGIMSLSWFQVDGFTPRTPTGVETAKALVCGYNQDSTTLQWYITIQIVGITSNAVLSDPPTGFVVGVRAAFVYTPQWNQL
jgi:hypothetical protein